MHTHARTHKLMLNPCTEGLAQAELSPLPTPACQSDKEQLRFELRYTITDKGLCNLHTAYLLHLLKQSTLYVNKYTTGPLYCSPEMRLLAARCH